MKLLRMFLTSSALAWAWAHSSHDGVVANPDEGKQGRPSPGRGQRGAFEAQKTGGRLVLCPTGDCKQSIMEISMEKLREVDANGNTTVKQARNFQSMDYTWTAPNTAINEQGVNVTTSSFNSVLSVENSTANVTFKAFAAFYHQNGTALNGKQIIDVPEGSLKFAVWIENWPFLSDTNKLRLGLRVRTRNKKGEEKAKGVKDRTKRGRDGLIERMDLGDAMYLDSPLLAQVDQVMKNISSFTYVNEGFVLVEYEFPKFTTLYYDPVMTSEEPLDDSTIRSSSAGSLLRVTAAGSITTALLATTILAFMAL